MMNKPNLQPPTYNALKTLIESYPGYHTGHGVYAYGYPSILEGDVDGNCDTFCPLYASYFANHRVPAAYITAPDHDFLVVKTSDRGIVFFDPTFCQFYPNYPEPYFLGSGQQLADYVEQHGGWDELLMPGSLPADNTYARGAYRGCTVDSECFLSYPAANQIFLKQITQAMAAFDTNASFENKAAFAKPRVATAHR